MSPSVVKPYGPHVSPEERFWRHVEVRGIDECWPWTAATGTRGQAIFWNGTRLMSAARFAYAMTRGPLWSGWQVRHRCDNPPCVNPRHLQIGTAKDNATDMMERGRNNPGRGFTDDQIREIRARRLAGESYGSIARDFDTGGGHICIITQRKIYQDVV